MLQFGKYKMDANQRINQLIAENEMLRNVNKCLASGRDMAVEAAKELGYQFSTEVSPLDYLIETARASVMVNQKSVELMAERDALLVYAIDAEKWFNKHDPHGYVSPKRADVQAVLATHDAEVAAKAVLEFAAKLLANQKVDVIDCAKVEADQLRAKVGA